MKGEIIFLTMLRSTSFCCLLLLATVFKHSLTMSSSKHIILILADDLGWNDVGYQNSDVITPNIDKLAREGVKLNSSYMQPLCTPSRSSILSGYYPFRDGLQGGVIRADVAKCLPLHRTLLSEKLKGLGYATHLVGKWHLGMCNLSCTPTFRGFDSFLGFYNGDEDFYTKVTLGGVDFYNNTEPIINTEYSTTIYGNRAVEIVETHDKSKPLFLFLSFQAPHCPLQVPDEYLEMYPQMNVPRRRIFSAMVTAMDEAIGNVVKALKRERMYKDTLIIFSSDNGGVPTSTGNNYPLRGSKGTLFEGGTRVVGFVHGSGLTKTRTVYDGMIHAVDWYPTIYAAAGGNVYDLDDSIDGINQWDAIRTGDVSARNEIVYNINEILTSPNGAIRVGDYKLIHGYPGMWRDWYRPEDEYFSDACAGELGLLFRDIINVDFCQNRSMFDAKMLFDLRNDPYERNDISADHPDIVNDLFERMNNYRRVLTPPKPDIGDPNSNPSLYGGYWAPGWC